MTANRQPTVFEAAQWIGRGATGTVWAGTHLPSGRRVALKWLIGTQPWADLRREARLMARLDHPALLPIFDLVPLIEPGTTQARPCLVMAYAPGGSLAPWRGRLGPLQVEAIARVLLAGLGQLGAQGLVHQDIKPANVLLMPAPGGWRPVLADFGVGREHTDGIRAGTPRYLAPELREGGPVGPWSDLFSLGECFRALLDRPPPPRLGGWLARLTCPAPEARPASAAEALALLGGDPTAGALVLPEAAEAVALDETTSVVADPIGPPADARHPPLARAPVEVPERWGAPRPPRPPLLWRGLALWRLRRPPLVGRLAERDALWAMLRAAAEGPPTLIVLAGPPGSGASRLAAWLAETAHARAGWRIVRTGDAAWPFPEAPPAIWLLDPPDEPALLTAARAALEASAPACVVAVTRPERAHEVARALGRPATAPLLVPPLEAAAMVHLLRQRLNLGSSLAERIAAHTEGRPGAAIAAIEVLLPALVEGPAGLELPDPLTALPADLARPWRASVDRLFATTPPADQPAIVALAISAPIAREALDRLCVAARLPSPAALLERLADEGLVTLEAPIRFSSPAFADAVRLARPEWTRRLHAIALAQPIAEGAAGAIARLGHAVGAGLTAEVLVAAANLAEPMIDLGDLIRLEPLVAAARRLLPDAEVLTILEARIALVLGDRPTALARLARIDLDRLPTPALRLTVLETRSMVHLAHGEVAAAEALVPALIAVGRAPGFALRARLARARIKAVGGHHAEVVALLSAALDDAPPALALRGELYLQEALAEEGRTDEAVARLPRLFASLDAADQPGLVPHAHNYAGNTWLRHGTLDRARASFQSALTLAGDRMPVGAYFHLNLALVDLRAGDAEAAARRLASLAPRFDPWPVRIAQLMDALRLQASVALGHVEAWPALVDRLEECVDANAARDTRDALEAAARGLPEALSARVHALIAPSGG